MSVSEPVTSRAGSHAGRGFRYQDAAGVWLVVRCWASELPYGQVMPEGQDDYELRGATNSAFAQVKSRRDHLGPFPMGEVVAFVRALWARSEAASSTPDDLILVLERPVAQGPTVDHVLSDHPGLAKTLRSDPRWTTLAPRTRVWIAPAPFEVAVATISHTMPCAPLAAQVHYGELLNQIGTLADANGLVKDGRFEGLAVSDVETSVRRMEPILDLAGMEAALRYGYCDAVDFLTPADDPRFYQGVDTRPSHLAAGLVAERPEARRAVLAALEACGAALIVGLSGTGKSALMWEAARAARHTTRWFEVKRGDSADAHLLTRLARALRASPAAPVGFVLDDVGRGGGGLWDALIREAGAGSGILLLGSIREEDVFILNSRSRAREIRPSVEDAVAERIWRRLSDQGQTCWAGWREPWGRSDGLLLEYTHILTRGDRLKIVLGEQVDRRLRETRDVELAILRVTALAGAAGATIESGRLPSVLGITQGDLTRAQRRLVDEHLVAELADGRLGGLHQLRSATLLDLCHAHPPPTLSHTVEESVHTAHGASVNALATYVIVHLPDATAPLVNALAVRLERDCDPVVMAAALSGLGQAHVETTLKRWVPEVLSLGLEPTQVCVAVMFAVAGLDLSSLPIPERLQGAVRVLRTRSASDPRLNLLSTISPDAMSALFAAADTIHLRALLGALVGVEVPESVRSALSTLRPAFDTLDLTEAADLLGAARLIDPQIATNWADVHVCENLLARVPLETPWAGPVEVEVALEGRLLRGSIFHVAPSAQTDVHDEVVQLCNRLLGLDPTAMVAAVDAVAADSLPSGLPGYPLATKRILRENLPPSALPDWNRHWTAAAARLVGTESYTDYLKRAHALLEQLVPVLERIVDGVLRSKLPPPKIWERFGDVHEASRALTPPRDGPPTGGAPEQYSTPLQNLLFYCSGDLLRRFAQLPEGYGAFVMWAGDLLKNVQGTRSEPWALIGAPPEKLLGRLESLIASLRLLAAEAGTQEARPTQLWLSEVRRAELGNALRRARMAVEHQLQVRTTKYLQQVKVELEKNSIELELHARPDWNNPLPWPTLELLAIVDMESPTDWLIWYLEKESLIRAAIGESRHIQIVPRIGGLAISRLTVGGVSTLLASAYVVDDWLDALHISRLDDTLTRAAQIALDSIVELDGLRRFGLGTEGRPVVEQAVRADDERRLAGALIEFERLAEGEPVQLLLRRLSEEVAAGHVALAEDIAALTHGRLTPGAEALMNLQDVLLVQDITTALRASAAKA
ncbi:hypothetical protein BK662_12830 [Pseudomonas frederiksbergensis]|uniref:Uncharacterized protein n=2 Tax=Pseudomonas frederiksbergensis TaxID=104087 RepID=A0A423HQY7_9PSED|nr:hypothetical protein BK662_12830 [Pseudomonas frederiksbergensis]